jgi:hypothetical protein
MRFLLLHTWPGNVGNRFVQKGAKASIRRAFPDAEIIEVDGYPRYRSDLIQFERAQTRTQQARQLVTGVRDSTEMYRDNMFNLLDITDGDVAVLPGCSLYEPALQDYRETLTALSERDIPVVFLGAGGGDYQPKTKQYVREMFDEVPPAGLLTRDSDAYEAYGDHVPFAYDGIDCAYFIDDWYEPPAADKQLVAATFDRTDEPTIPTDELVVRPTHYHPAFGYGKNIEKQQDKSNLFVSESLKEFLFIYANAVETHADRVHACVPALVYGNRARLYLDSPRSALFDDLVEGSLDEELSTIDRPRLDEEKQNQIEAFRDVVTEVV